MPAGPLTIYNNLSVSDVIYDKAGNSNNWNSVYNSVLATSANWDNVYTSVSQTSANWDNVYTSVSQTSANWDNVYTSVATTSGDWNSVYSTVCALSVAWEESAEIIPTVTNYLSTNNILISSITVTDSADITGNVVVHGNLSATGTSYFANTIFSTTTSISVVHIGDVEPAMWVGNSGTGDIASFYDIDAGIEILHVGGVNSTLPNVGIRVSNPNKTLTVNGEISANNVIYDRDGNSVNWNSVYTTTNANSANWGLGYDGYTILNSNSANWQNTYTTVQSNSATTWNYQGEDLKALSGGWVGGNIAYTNLIANSGAYLSGVDLSFLSVSANWDNVYTDVSQTSANWDSVYSSVASTSANWDSVYTTTNANSANWGLGYDGYTILNSNSANWQNTYTTVDANSANWDNNSVISYVNTNFVYNTGGIITGDLTVTGNISSAASYYGDGSNLTGIIAGDTAATALVRSSSGSWDAGYYYGSVYSSNSAFYTTYTDLSSVSALLVLNSDFDAYKTNVAAATATLLPSSIYQSASSKWENTYSTVYSVSANWNNTLTTVQSNSSNWSSVYSTVAANSATYVTTTPTTTPGLSAITKIIAVSALPITQDAGTLYIIL
jgi:hypothetical protein